MNQTYFKYAFILALFAGISGLLLSGVNHFTKDRVSLYAKNSEIKACEEILPQAASFVNIKSNDFEYRVGLDELGVTVGYLLKVSEVGYSSDIQTLVAVDRDFNVSGMKILFQQETPGLGTKIVEIVGDDKQPWFQRQFFGKNQKMIVLKKDGGTLDAIAGATISSKAVVLSVYDGISNLKNEVGVVSTQK